MYKNKYLTTIQEDNSEIFAWLKDSRNTDRNKNKTYWQNKPANRAFILSKPSNGEENNFKQHTTLEDNTEIFAWLKDSRNTDWKKYKTLWPNKLANRAFIPSKPSGGEEYNF